MNVVREEAAPGDVPLYVHGVWADRFPWLMQGTTAKQDPSSEQPFDLGLFGNQPVGPAVDRWLRLREATGMPRAVHSRQKHGAALLLHDIFGPPGLSIAEGHDGHITRVAGVMLAVSIADCVPVFLVDPGRRAVALLHAGWRGIAAGILEGALQTLKNFTGSRAGNVFCHFGPAICGDCYEVGPEVHVALGQPEPETPAKIDLRRLLAERGIYAGLRPERITRSAFCTKCGDSPFFSHRGGEEGRQMGVLGVRLGSE